MRLISTLATAALITALGASAFAAAPAATAPAATAPAPAAVTAPAPATAGEIVTAPAAIEKQKAEIEKACRDTNKADEAGYKKCVEAKSKEKAPAAK